MGNGASEKPVGGILAPGHMRAFSRAKGKLQELRDRAGEVLDDVYCAVPGNSPMSRDKVPDETPIVEDQVPGKDGPLVGFYSLLTELEKPVMILRSDRPIPPKNVLEALLEAWEEEDDPTGVYVMEPAERIPSPAIVHPGVIKKLRQQLQEDPTDVEFFMRTINARKVKP